MLLTKNHSRNYISDPLSLFLGITITAVILEPVFGLDSISSLLTSEQTWNIVKFMKEEWVNPGDLYDLTVTGGKMSLDKSTDPPTLVKPELAYSNIGKGGNAANGDTLFQSKCAGCHGNDGKQIEVGGKTGVGQFIRQKLHEAWFKVKFGEPGTGMTPGLLTETSDLKDLYKALTNTTTYPD